MSLRTVSKFFAKGLCHNRSCYGKSWSGDRLHFHNLKHKTEDFSDSDPKISFVHTDPIDEQATKLSSPPLFTFMGPGSFCRCWWVVGVTERLWLGCRPDFMPLWVPATVSGGRSLLRRRDKSLETQFWCSHLQFFKLLRDLLSFVLRVERPTAAKNEALDAHCPFPHSFQSIRRGITGMIFLVNRGNHQLMQWGRATGLEFLCTDTPVKETYFLKNLLKNSHYSCF